MVTLSFRVRIYSNIGFLKLYFFGSLSKSEFSAALSLEFLFTFSDLDKFEATSVLIYFPSVNYFLTPVNVTQTPPTPPQDYEHTTFIDLAFA